MSLLNFWVTLECAGLIVLSFAIWTAQEDNDHR